MKSKLGKEDGYAGNKLPQEDPANHWSVASLGLLPLME
jgi:hypothetical protein